nr:MAG TPA: hypothetical protein [Inoviridae sp.]
MPPLFFARAHAVAHHGQGCAVGGARWCYGMRAAIRRDCRGCARSRNLRPEVLRE